MTADSLDAAPPTLPMPSDVRRQAEAADAQSGTGAEALPEPPSAKLVVRLFLIPFLIVATAVGIVYLISLVAGGGAPSREEAIGRIKRGAGEGGGRTAHYLLGPGSKQLYMDAMVLANELKAGDLSETDRVALSGGLVDILDGMKPPREGELEPTLILALARTWQVDPSKPPTDSAEGRRARQEALAALTEASPKRRDERGDALPARVDDADVVIRKAAVLALSYWAGRDDLRPALVSVLLRKLESDPELDVRMAAATALGPVGANLDPASDGELRRSVVSALNRATNEADERSPEIVWSSAGSLAQMGQPEAKGTLLMLLDRAELSQLRYYDREAGADDSKPRPLDEPEQQRILINTMDAARNLNDPDVRRLVQQLSDKDPSHRVREAAKEYLRTTTPATEK